MKRIVFAASALVLASLGCTHNPQVAPDQTPTVQAKVIDVTQAMTPSTLDLTGVIAARQLADIASQVLAPIAEIRVHEGQAVRKGDVLIRLSSAPLQAAVVQAQSQLLAAQAQQKAAGVQKDLAAATYGRYATLSQRHSVTPYEFDQVKAQLDSAEAQFKASSAQAAAADAATHASEATSAYTTIRAPFSGIVTHKYVDAGALASPGTPLLQIEDATEHEVDIQVNESSLKIFRPSAQVQVQVDGSPTPILGKVQEIVPGGDPAAHTFTIKIGLPASSGLYSGMTANVLIPSGEHLSVTIPLSAVRERGQLDSVLALDSNSVAHIKYVTLGRKSASAVEVISGLAAGDKILAQPNDALLGHKIEAQP